MPTQYAVEVYKNDDDEIYYVTCTLHMNTNHSHSKNGALFVASNPWHFCDECSELYRADEQTNQELGVDNGKDVDL